MRGQTLLVKHILGERAQMDFEMGPFSRRRVFEKQKRIITGR
jgi:hypothetical protein